MDPFEEAIGRVAGPCIQSVRGHLGIVQQVSSWIKLSRLGHDDRRVGARLTGTNGEDASGFIVLEGLTISTRTRGCVKLTRRTYEARQAFTHTGDWIEVPSEGAGVEDIGEDALCGCSRRDVAVGPRIPHETLTVSIVACGCIDGTVSIGSTNGTFLEETCRGIQSEGTLS